MFETFSNKHSKMFGTFVMFETFLDAGSTAEHLSMKNITNRGIPAVISILGTELYTSQEAQNKPLHFTQSLSTLFGSLAL